VTITSWLFRYWFITLPCLYLLIIVILKCGTYMLYLTSTSPRKKIKCLFLFSLGFLYGLHMTRKIDESLVEYAKRLEESYFDATTLLSAWTGSYLKAVFGDEFSETDCREAEETYHAFRKIYKQKVAICMRVLGFFNPVNSLKRKV
jgi:hypothetical protein